MHPLRRSYDQLGTEGVRAALRDFYGRMSKDLLVGFFFSGRDTDLIADRQLAFVSKVVGITSDYTGKAPPHAHDDLPPILGGHFDRRLVLLEETLRDHGLTPEQARTWVDFERSFRKAIVRTEK